MNPRIKREYFRLRSQGWQGVANTLRAARINVAWQDAENEGLVMLDSEPEQEEYEFPDYSDLRPSLRKRYEAEDRATAEREGVWCYFAKAMIDGEWETVDSLGMVVGSLEDGGSDVDLKAAALDRLAEHQREQARLAEPMIYGARCA